MNFLLYTLILLGVLNLVGFVAVTTFIVIEFKQRKEFKDGAHALIQTHNQLMLRMAEAEKKASDAVAGIAYIKSLPQFKGGR